MSLLFVKEHLKEYNKENDIIELSKSTANVELVAKELNIEHGRITKTLSFKMEDTCILTIIAGDKKSIIANIKRNFT